MDDKVTQTPATEAGTQTPQEPVTMEQALQQAEAHMEQNIQRGQVLKGTVVLVGNEGVAVDVGAKVEGIIPFNQITEESLSEEELKALLKPRDQVEVYVVRVDLPNNVIVLSKKRADADHAWRGIISLYEQGAVVDVQVKEKVRGGLVAYLEGVRAFLPASQVDLKRVGNLDTYAKQTLSVKIIELARKKGRIILSRRAVLEEEQKHARAKTLEALEVGQEIEGEVVEVTDFGGFISLGGIDGLVHRSEISWGRFNHPREVLKVGATLRARVLSVDTERERVNLSAKALTSDPWVTVSEAHPVGGHVRGKVVGLTPFGAFVEVEPGLEGLIHISEMSWTKRPKHPSEIVKEGDEVEAVVLRIDPQERRLSLGLRQTQPDPWKELPDRFPPGTVVNGKVTGVTDFGVFVQLEPGIEGLVHISELDYTRIDSPTSVYKKGDDAEVVVLQIDPVEQRISLSRKRLLPPPMPSEEEVATGEPPRSERGGDHHRTRSKKQQHRNSRGSRGGTERGDFGQHEIGATAVYNQYDASVASPSSTNVKLGDLYGDLLESLELGEEARG